MATPDSRPVSSPPAPELPDHPPPAQSSVPARTGDGAPILDDEHQLPVHKGKVGRVTDHVKGAADSLTDWFELRIALLKREVKDEIAAKKAKAEELGKAYGILAVLALVTAVLALFVFGFLFSALWGLLIGEGHELWSLTAGFGTLFLLFAIGALIAKNRAEKKTRELSAADPDDPRAPDTPND